MRFLGIMLLVVTAAAIGHRLASSDAAEGSLEASAPVDATHGRGTLLASPDASAEVPPANPLVPDARLSQESAEGRAETRYAIIDSPDEVPDEAVNAERMRMFLSSNDYQILSMQARCTRDLQNRLICRSVPGTLISEHPYYEYPLESLAAMPGDALAQQVLSLRMAGRDPDAAVQHAIFAVGLSNGKTGPLVDIVQNSKLAIIEIDGRPALESIARAYVVLEAARRLGDERVSTYDRHETLSEHLPPEELALLEEEIERLLAAIEAVPPARTHGPGY